MKRIFSLGILFVAITGYSQNILRGKVINEKTKEPLPFVNIALKNTQRGTTSDVEGRFAISWDGIPPIIVFSFLGFEKFEYQVSTTTSLVTIRLKEKPTELQAVIIRPGDNPALKIIRKATANREINDPENLPSFSYNAYNKLFLTMDGTEDSLASPLLDSLNQVQDSTVTISQGMRKREISLKRYQRLKRFADRNHIFVAESYTERKYVHPNLTKETVLANKMTGVKDPFFAFLATDFQPFSFYKDYIPLFDKNYLNPISKGSTERYDFTLIDTVYHQRDSVFIIAFEPLPGKDFDGLKGQLYISNDGYALEHVIAQPADDKTLIESRIQQKYEKSNGHWFPVQLNSELRFKEYKIGMLKFLYVSRSYLTNIQIGNQIPKREFGTLNVEFAPKANRQEDAYWSAHRTDSLGSKEKSTYRLYDSLAHKLKGMNNMISMIEGLTLGHFKAGPFYLPLEYLVKFNKYEGVRLGAGLQTNERVSRFFSIGGYAGYGFNDKALKYGGNLQLNLYPAKEVFIRFSYQQDLNEPGSMNYMRNSGPSVSNQSLRNWLTSKMDSIQLYKVEFGIRPFRFSQMILFLRQQNRNPAYAYTFISSKDPAGLTKNYIATEVGLQLRYAFRESYTQIGNGKIATNYAFPQINLFASDGISGSGDGQYDFKKLEIQLDQRWLIRGLGKTTVQLDGGKIVGDVPYPFLFNGKGSRFDNTLLDNFVINNYFQTMGLYEFASDQYAYFFLNHNFGRLTGTKSRYFRPELIIQQNIGFGSLNNPSAHQGIGLKTMEQGFYESGLQLNNIFRFKYVHMFYYGIGLGAFYRYGYYALPIATDNIALKLTITASF